MSVGEEGLNQREIGLGHFLKSAESTDDAFRVRLAPGFAWPGPEVSLRAPAPNTCSRTCPRGMSATAIDIAMSILDESLDAALKPQPGMQEVGG